MAAQPSGNGIVGLMSWRKLPSRPRSTSDTGRWIDLAKLGARREQVYENLWRSQHVSCGFTRGACLRRSDAPIDAAGCVQVSGKRGLNDYRIGSGGGPSVSVP
jgi:hypothetical protein